MGCVVDKRDHTWYRTVWLGEDVVAAKLDTGAEVNVLPLLHYKKLTAALPLQQCNTVLTAFGGAKYKACGKTSILMKFAMGDEAHTENFIVADVEGDLILGGDTLLSHKLMNINMVNVLDSENKLIQKYPDLFNGKLGKVSYTHTPHTHTHTHNHYLKENAHPVVNAPRKVPAAMKPKVQAELTRVEKLDVIPKFMNQLIESAQWSLFTNQMVPFGCALTHFTYNKQNKNKHFEAIFPTLLGVSLCSP